MNNLFDIKGNVTVITGGTGVLGRAIAKYLAHEGDNTRPKGRCGPCNSGGSHG